MSSGLKDTLKDIWHFHFPPFRSEIQRMVKYQALWLSYYALNPAKKQNKKNPNLQ